MSLSSIMSKPLPVALKNSWLTRNTKEGLRSLSVSLDHTLHCCGADQDHAGKELDDYLTANPNKSIYCFSLNRKRPGHFNLVFKANRDSPTQTWVRSISTLTLHGLIVNQPVRVAQEAYYLFETMVPSVPELCDAFKYR